MIKNTTMELDKSGSNLFELLLVSHQRPKGGGRLFNSDGGNAYIFRQEYKLRSDIATLKIMKSSMVALLHVTPNKI